MSSWFKAKTEFLVIAGEEHPTLRAKTRNFSDYDLKKLGFLKRIILADVQKNTIVFELFIKGGPE
jgi:hypothetical protein